MTQFFDSRVGAISQSESAVRRSVSRVDQTHLLRWQPNRGSGGPLADSRQCIKLTTEKQGHKYVLSLSVCLSLCHKHTYTHTTITTFQIKEFIFYKPLILSFPLRICNIILYKDYAHSCMVSSSLKNTKYDMKLRNDSYSITVICLQAVI